LVLPPFERWDTPFARWTPVAAEGELSDARRQRGSIAVGNLVARARITLPHMQALASLHVRFKIHDGYDSNDEDKRKPSEKLTAEKLEMLAC